MGPLNGITVIEFAGLGPAPFCGMMLSDMGADVIRIDRADDARPRAKDVLSRGRRSIAVDLKSPAGRDVVLKLCAGADAILEGFRPGVMERLGLGPEDLAARNPKLVYGRMTGWGQEGPLAHAAGHDPNYIALTGALHAIGRAGDKPVLPLNLIGDFGGGGMLLAFGVVAALLEASRSGKGQVVDAAMVDGAATLMALIYGLNAQGVHRDERGSNFLDGASHFNDVYETSDGGFISIASLEKPFYDQLIDLLGLDPEVCAGHMNPRNWARLKVLFAETFIKKTRGEWCALLEGTDVCFAPVLSLTEAPHHPHIAARSTFRDHDGMVQPAPSPRFSRTPGDIAGPSRAAGADTREILAELGLTVADIDGLVASGAVKDPSPTGALA
jgi:alpha-methylacyl-CoA racemase